MDCPEHLVIKAFSDKVYLWLYWRDVPRKTIPLRVWANPFNYELSIRTPWKFIRINPEGKRGRDARMRKWNKKMGIEP